MFYTDREALIKAITILQRSVCCYDMYSIQNESPPPESCDCKYGADHFVLGHGGGEQTFCPELRCVIKLLTNINNKEYMYLMER